MGMRLRVLPISHGFAVGIDVADRGLACAATSERGPRSPRPSAPAELGRRAGRRDPNPLPPGVSAGQRPIGSR